MFPTKGQVTHALLTRPPLSFISFVPKNSIYKTPFDLHVLGMPPAFVLSQDQTLHNIFEFLAHSLTCLRYFRFRKNCLNCLGPHYPASCFDSVFLSSGFVRFIQLFNFQRASAVSRQLLYIITSSLPCQHLFSIIFQIFHFVLTARRRLRYSIMFPLLLSTSLSTSLFYLYHNYTLNSSS